MSADLIQELRELRTPDPSLAYAQLRAALIEQVLERVPPDLRECIGEQLRTCSDLHLVATFVNRERLPRMLQRKLWLWFTTRVGLIVLAVLLLVWAWVAAT